MTAARNEDHLLKPDEARRRAVDAAAVYLARARLQVDAAFPIIDPLTGFPPRGQSQDPDILAAMIQAQTADYLAWVISARLTITNDALENIANALRDIARALESR